MTDLITELCQLTAEILQNNPQANNSQLVKLVKVKIDTNLELNEAMQNAPYLSQTNQGDSKGFQTLVTGGIAKIGVHFNDVSKETIEEILKEILHKDVQEKKNLYNSTNGYTSETVYSTLFPVSEMPNYIYAASCTYNDQQTKEAANQLIHNHKKGIEMYPFLLRQGKLFCFQNLKNPNTPFKNIIDQNQCERYLRNEWLEDPEQAKWFVSLLNRSLNKLTGRKGLQLDKEHNRYFFPLKKAGEFVKITYRPLNQSHTTRNVVWRPENKKKGELHSYWYHLATSLKFHQVAKDQWCLSIRPEMRITKDGFKLYESKKIGGRVTHKKSRIFNYDLLKDVNFWRDFLSDSQPQIIFNFDQNQRIFVSTTMLQTEIEWEGIPEEYAKPFKNVEYPQDLFSWAKLEGLDYENEDTDDWNDWENEDVLEESYNNE